MLKKQTVTVIRRMMRECDPEKMHSLAIDLGLILPGSSREIHAIKREVKLERYQELRNIVVDLVCGAYDVLPSKFYSTNKKTEAAHARHLYSWIMSRITVLSLKDLAMTMTAGFNGKKGIRDHATIVHSKKVAENLIETDHTFRQKAWLVATALDKMGHKKAVTGIMAIAGDKIKKEYLNDVQQS